MKKFNSSYVGIRREMLKFIEDKENTILDVGCASGANGQYLLDSGKVKSVYGVEYDQAMANEAQKYYDHVFVGDLNDNLFVEGITRQSPKFDYILFGDVLEHLLNAKEVLQEIATLLKDDGKIIISVPNIAHLELFIQVYIKGEWPRNERGIFDKTHLTWFTKKEVYKMAEFAGLKIDKYETNIRARDRIGSKFTFIYKIIKAIKPDLFTFQHIIVCSKK